MKQFVHYDIPEIRQINEATGRRYSTPEGKLYPSVTSVLAVEANPFLDAWRARVGEAEADRISKVATNRGSRVHEACENYLQGKDHAWGIAEADAEELFAALIPVLESVGVVHAMETRMWSDKLEVAGTVDLICEIDGQFTIIDYKTSSRYKRREDIPNYFMQMASYAVMFYERTGIVVPNIMVAMTVPEVGLLTYKEKTKPWIPGFLKLRKQFREVKGY